MGLNCSKFKPETDLEIKERKEIYKNFGIDTRKLNYTNPIYNNGQRHILSK